MVRHFGVYTYMNWHVSFMVEFVDIALEIRLL